jgi:hypothetical protein
MDRVDVSQLAADAAYRSGALDRARSLLDDALAELAHFGLAKTAGCPDAGPVAGLAALPAVEDLAGRLAAEDRDQDVADVVRPVLQESHARGGEDPCPWRARSAAIRCLGVLVCTMHTTSVSQPRRYCALATVTDGS